MERELWPPLYHLCARSAATSPRSTPSTPPGSSPPPCCGPPCTTGPCAGPATRGNWSTTRLRPASCPSPAPSAAASRAWPSGCAPRPRGPAARGRHPARVRPTWTASRCRSAAAARTRTPRPRGRLRGHGYKLHAVWADRPVPEAWEVTAADGVRRPRSAGGWSAGPAGPATCWPTATTTPARCSTTRRPGGVPDGGCRPQGQEPGAGKGHRYQSPHRLRCIELLPGPVRQGAVPARGRGSSGASGNAGSFGGGLGPLPAWVRGADRVRTLGWAKLLINAARIAEKQRLTAWMQNVGWPGLPHPALSGLKRPPLPALPA